MIHRRDLFQRVAAIGAASVMGRSADAQQSLADQTESPTGGAAFIDTNVSLCHWPFRRLPLDEPEALIKRMRALGIAQAWAGSFEGLLHRDISSVNQRLADVCRRYPELIPFGSINPTLPGWESDVRACFEGHAMPGIRLHPNYHGYTLADPAFAKILQMSSSAGRLVQVCVAMEDTRTQHPLVQVTDVDLSPLPEVMTRNTNAKVQLLNYRPKPAEIVALAKIAGLSFDISRNEGTDGIAGLIRHVPLQRLMLGTHAPFLIPEAALIRVNESDLTDEALRSLLWKSAQALVS